MQDEHQGVLRRDDRQPEGRRPRHRGRRRRGPRNGVPLIVDNTIADAVPDPAVRVRRRHRRALGHQVPGRPRHRDRRRSSSTAARSTGPAASSPASPRPTRATTASSTPDLGAPAYALKARVQLLRDLGPAISPFNAFLLVQGIETLSLRMERHVAERRSGSPSSCEAPRRGRVGELRRAWRPRPWHAAQQKYAPQGRRRGARLRDRTAASRPGKRFVEALELHSHVANIGDVRSLVIHPASTTHSPAHRRGAADHRRHPGPGAARGRPGGRSRTSSPTSRPGSGPPRAPDDEVRTWRPDGRRLAARATRRRPAVPDRRRRSGPSAAASLPGVRVAYETWGTLDAGRRQRRPRRARAHRRQPRRRPGRAGPPDRRLVGRADRARAAPLDTDRWFVVCANVLGGCQGTTGPSSPAPDGGPWGSGSRRSPSATRCAVEAALADALGIDRWACVVGGSMGGMRALEWAVALPDRVARAVLPRLRRRRHGRPDRPADHRSRRPIRADPRWAGGDYYDPTSRPGRRAGHRPPDRAPHLPQRVRARRAVRPTQVRGPHGPATPSRPTSTTTPTSWPAGSTPAATSCSPRR